MSLHKASYTDLLPIVLLWEQLLHYSGRVTKQALGEGRQLKYTKLKW
jgi:hypothetical protein